MSSARPPRPQPVHSALQYPCERAGCQRFFKTLGGRTKHMRSAHLPVPPLPQVQPPPAQSLINPPADELDPDPASENAGDGAPLEPSPDVETQFYEWCTGRPCNERGEYLATGTPPPPKADNPTDWTPYDDRIQFETADFLFTRNQMAAPQIDALLDLWAATLLKHGDKPPFAHHRHLHQTIDNTPLGEIKWQKFSVHYTGEVPAMNPPPWMQESYEVWFRNPRAVTERILGNPSFASEMDYRPFREYSTEGDTRQFQDFMSGDWAWDQADIISEGTNTLGSTFVPIILGSDKTTVSVGTGNNEFYPLYLSIGNVRNNVRRAHRDALVLIGFLAIPKTTKEHASDTAFRRFRRQLFHSSLAMILNPFKPGMTKPEIVRFGDGHYRRVVYGLGPYIADYEEQALLTCIVRGWCPRCQAHRSHLDGEACTHCREFHEALFEESTLSVLWEEYGIVGDLVPFTNDFPRADIHQLIAPDILHQLIKGCFKDHLVDWVEAYLRAKHSKRRAEAILDDIDRRIAIVAPFAGLRRFPQGRGFKQWTGNDSKALMKVYIAAIEGHVPSEIVRTFRAFLEFCYSVRRYNITEKHLKDIEDALQRFHHYREFFKTGDFPVVTTFSLPRQHSAKHYPALIRLFGAPNGLCSSITECKHIKAVKEPYCRSSKYQALGQMLLTNQRLDKIAASRADFRSRGMLEGTCLSAVFKSLEEEDQPTASMQADNDETVADDSATNLAAHVELARTPRKPSLFSLVSYSYDKLQNESVHLHIPTLPDLIRRFLFDQIYPDDPRDQSEIPLAGCPRFEGRISTFNSASSRFYAPSDLSGIGGMQTEYIRSTPLWRNEGPRLNCVLVGTNADNSEDTGMGAYDIARVLAFFSFKYRGVVYPCAVIRWFDKIGGSPDEDTGMWMVRPAFLPNHSPHITIIHVDSIYRAAHLIPIFGSSHISRNIKPHHCYDAFRAFYVNKYADHHSFEIAA
ncbi:hypothetical protein HYDPIDRAFT_95108 [Hydnomerulius pinastri MD-312]|uniref:C2H2-type domain-containing protein n=1 Tax=Hydnomerulius pinastri MD-312 TaxID=994086 RepID=A0A0C9WD04_9AGAM|nr:hypothetical protein HYDPIDRAFT_95108 [Hydnomerulius pinastri MD-312]